MMPEENSNLSSGITPEERKGPTVIKTGGQERKPTVIGGGQTPTPVTPAAHKPTVITVGEQPIEKPEAKVVKASVIVPPVVTTVKTNVLHGGSQPTTMIGSKRKRLAVTFAELESKNVGTEHEVLNAALDLILITNLDELSDRDVVMWGHELQHRFAGHVTECLTLSQSEDLKNTSRNLARMLEILESIDLQAVFVPQGGILSRFMARSNKKIDTIEELKLACEEIQQLIVLLDKRLDGLLTLKGDLDTVSRKIESVGKEIEMSMIAALYLADYLSQGADANPVLSQRFAERGMSLTQSLVQIRTSSSMRDIQIEQPLAMIGRVQDVALVLVPGLIGTITSLKMMTEQNQKPTVTTVTELADQLGHIVQKLGGR